MGRLPGAGWISSGSMIGLTHSLQIQGSGRVRLKRGGAVQVGYEGQNGRPYVPVGRLLIESGAIPRDKLTMAAIRSWMKQNPEAGAALRREDPSYVFFREIKGDGPIGAEGAALSAERSIAVDRAFVALGVPVWLEADERFAEVDNVCRLMVAQDTGGAIKGPVRGDVFWGTGEAAGNRAGLMNARQISPAVASRSSAPSCSRPVGAAGLICQRDRAYVRHACFRH